MRLAQRQNNAGPGAIATTSLVPGGSLEEKWRFIRDGLSRFAGRELSLDEEVKSEESCFVINLGYRFGTK